MPPQALRRLFQQISSPTVTPVPHRGVISLAGSQASEFLNGILASSVYNTTVAGPSNGHKLKPMFSTFLHAQGRVLYDVFIYTQTTPSGSPGYLIEYDVRSSSLGAPALLAMLKRYVLRAKVKLRDVSDEYDVWAAFGSNATVKANEPKRKWNWARSGAVEPDWSAESDWPWGLEDGRIKDRRAIGMGIRMLIRKGDKPEESATHDLGLEDSYTLHRILHGVPEGSTDIPPMQAFPMDSNLDVMGGLDFRKGCYVGQELTVRTYHTGVIRKRILPILIHRHDQSLSSDLGPLIRPEFPTSVDIRAAAIQNETNSDRPVTRPRGTGKLLSSTRGVGLALLRLEHVEGTERGELKLGFEHGEQNEKELWSVTSWWPDWWPKQPVTNQAY